MTKKDDVTTTTKKAADASPAVAAGPVGTLVLIRLPDLEGKARWRPGIVVDEATQEVRVDFASVDRDVSASHAWALRKGATVGGEVGQVRVLWSAR